MVPSAQQPAAATPANPGRRVTRPDDLSERQAEQAAARASAPPTAPLGAGAVSVVGGAAPAVTESVAPSSSVEAVLLDGGRPLDPAARAVFEARLGHDLGSVRVHDGPAARDATHHLQALAFTAGSHVVLGPAAADWRTALGRRVLAHELVHTVQARTDGPVGPLRRVGMDPAAPDVTIPPEQMERVVRTLGEIVATVPAAPAASERGSSEAEPEQISAARRIAEYLVITEDFLDERLTALLDRLEKEAPVLLAAAALGGRLFLALRELGAVDLAKSVGWYLARSLRDTVAGDFVADPTALGIVLRTLLTLVPGLDTVADVEDVVANLLYGVLDPGTLLTSVGWWFGMVLALIGLFPEFGSAIKGSVQLTVKGLGALAKAGADVVARPVVRALERSGIALDAARVAVGDLLVTADAWRTWAISTFTSIVTLAITHLTTVLGAVTGALAQRATAILGALRQMLAQAPAWFTVASTAILTVFHDIQRVLDDALVAVGALSPEEAALRTVARTAGTHSRRAIRESVDRLARGGVDTKTLGHISKMTNVVFDAFASPAAFVAAKKTLVDERRLVNAQQIKKELDELDELRAKVGAARGTLGTDLTPEAAAYVAAVRRLATARRTGVVEIHRTGPDSILIIRRDVLGNPTEKILTTPGGDITHDDFMTEVVAGGDLILDYPALKFGGAFKDADFGVGAHSAISHVLQDLVADKALKNAGFTGGAVEFRERMAWLQERWDAVAPNQLIDDPDFDEAVKAGTALWVGTYDRIRSLAQPERLWTTMLPFFGPLIRQGDI